MTDQATSTGEGAATEQVGGAAATEPAAGTPAASAPAADAGTGAASAAVRPEGLPDAFWDADAGALKVGDVAAKLRAVAEREAAIPADASGYALDFADLGVELPEGFKLDLDADSDFVKEVVGAVAGKLTPDEYKGLVQAEARRQIAEQTRAVEAYAAEKAKLGANADQRLKALSDFVTANLPKAQAEGLLMNVTNFAASVEALEALVALARRTGPGAAPSVPGGKSAFPDTLYGADRLAAIRAAQAA